MDGKKTAIVMGATSGIGKEVALLLAEKGWNLGISGRRTDKLEELKTSILSKNADGNDGCTNVSVAVIDITSEDAPQQLRTFIDELGGIDLYFHSSGIGFQNVALDFEKEISTVKTNALGYTQMITTAFHYFAEHLERMGQISVISSIAGTKGLGAAPAYSATKRFQRHYIESLVQLSRMRHLNIDFTEIRPGFVATDLLKGAFYPMQLSAESVAKKIVRAIEKHQSVVTIDWRYRILVFFWQLVPRCIWVRLKIKTA